MTDKFYRMNVVRTCSRTLFILVASLAVFTACETEQQNICRIEGFVSGAFSDDIYLFRKTNRKLAPLDTATVTDGRFRFKDRNLQSPEMLYLKAQGRKEYIQLFAENSHISVNIPIDSMSQTQVNGSRVHTEYADFLENNKAYANKLEDLYRQLQLAREKGDTLLLHDLDSVKQLLIREQEAFLFRYVLENGHSHIAVYITAESLANFTDYAVLKKITENFSLELSVSVYYQKLQDIIRIKKALQAGMPLPDLAVLPSDAFNGKTYIRIFFPYPDSFFLQEFSARLSQNPRLFKTEEIRTIALLPETAKHIVPSAVRYEPHYVDTTSYERFSKVYDVRYAYKNFVIGKDSLILKSGRTIEETNEYIKKLTNKSP